MTQELADWREMRAHDREFEEWKHAMHCTRFIRAWHREIGWWRSLWGVL